MEEDNAKKDQEIHMADLRIRELERYIYFNTRPKQDTTDAGENENTGTGRELRFVEMDYSVRSHAKASRSVSKKSNRSKKSVRVVGRRGFSISHTPIDHLPIPE